MATSEDLRGHATRLHLSRGMTLVELLLVLALLVLIGSMVLPVFTGSFASVRLRRAGDEVLAQWARARARAIETGDVYQFRYTPESGAYRIEPWRMAQQIDEAGAGAASPGAAPPPVSATDDEKTDESGEALPEEIVFHGGQIAVDDPLAQERRVEALQASGGELSTPILFFPDGTTSDASVVIANERPQYVRLTLRSLTGVGRASDILARDELDEATSGR